MYLEESTSYKPNESLPATELVSSFAMLSFICECAEKASEMKMKK